MAGRTCRQCNSPWEAHSQNRPTCTVCSRYRAIKQNAARPRRDGSTTGLGMTRKQFARWFARQERRCHYCGVDEDRLPQLGLKTQMGMELLRLGVDRINSRKPYTIRNIVPCCYACNSVKSDRFNRAEMEDIIGPALAEVWNRRPNLLRPMPRRTPARLEAA